MKQEKITTLKMPKETERQYWAWLLYCKTESINKLLKKWKELRRGISKPPAELKGIKRKIGKPPSRGTIVRWSKKFQWVKRKDLKLTKDSEILQEEMKKIKQEEEAKFAKLIYKLPKMIPK